MAVTKYSFLPTGIRATLATVGGLTLFALRFGRELFGRPFEGAETLRQAYQLGYRSLFLVSVSAFIIGMVLILQLRPTMLRFGAEAYLPATVAIAVLREIGPVLTAMICAGKIGAGIGAELGAMKISEQIDAMEVSGTHPFRFLVVTRVLALTLTLPLLVVYANTLALLGAYVATSVTDDTTLRLFFIKALDLITLGELVPALLKSAFFGFAIGLVGCYMGYQASEGTVGVGRAAHASVVVASLLVFVIDMLAVQFTQLFLT